MLRSLVGSEMCIRDRLSGVRGGAISLKALSILSLPALDQQRLFSDWFFDCSSLSDLLAVPEETPACSLEMCVQCILAAALEHVTDGNPAAVLLDRCWCCPSPGHGLLLAKLSLGAVLALADDDSLDRAEELTQLQRAFNSYCAALPDAVFLNELIGHLEECRGTLSMEALTSTHSLARLLVLAQLQESATGSGSRLEQSPVSYLISQQFHSWLSPNDIMAHRCWESYRRWSREGSTDWLGDSLAALRGLSVMSLHDARAVAWQLWSGFGLVKEVEHLCVQSCCVDPHLCGLSAQVLKVLNSDLTDSVPAEDQAPNPTREWPPKQDFPLSEARYGVGSAEIKADRMLLTEVLVLLTQLQYLPGCSKLAWATRLYLVRGEASDQLQKYLDLLAAATDRDEIGEVERRRSVQSLRELVDESGASRRLPMGLAVRAAKQFEPFSDLLNLSVSRESANDLKVPNATRRCEENTAGEEASSSLANYGSSYTATNGHTSNASAGEGLSLIHI
eukprot:TRINITY_DN44543_c0_g1_i1.p1 TRINITY_DN44543_c0_g1~~TRINITY_DN44543_c0_g1_i1.p1  ORF type:complete len:534 (-),score=105.36 TRINITY_DN44543_c0_g1_i1:135-1652(-)